MLVAFLFNLVALHAEINPPCAPSATPLYWSQMASVRHLVDKVAPPDLTDIDSLLGTCDENTHDVGTIIKQMRFKLSDVNAALGRRFGDGDFIKGDLPDVRKEDHTKATMADFLAVDVVARTLFSEVGTQPSCGIRYIAALGRVLINRADAVAGDESKRHLWARPGTNDIGHILADVVLSPRQFQVWRPKSAANLTAMCPATQLSQKYATRDKNGNKVSSGIASNNAWSDCVSVAAYMVFRDRQFREITSGMDAVNYTSGTKEGVSRPKNNYQPLNVKMRGEALPNDPKCMQFWNNPKAEE